MKHFLIIFLVALIISNAYSQDLKKAPLSKEDSAGKVLSKYIYEEKGAYGYIGLKLYANGSFEYSMSTFNRTVISNGSWQKKNSMIVLNSYIKKDDLPVKVSYSETQNVNKKCPFNIIHNLNGQEVSDAFVMINNDNTQCLPSYESCMGEYVSIDSIKIRLENGMTSKWIKLDAKFNSKQIDIVIQTTILPSLYFPIDNEKYKIQKNVLKNLSYNK